MAIAASFHTKAALFVKGRRTQKEILEQPHEGEWVWFHAASLGEYEQGKPVMEGIKVQFPEIKILLTFYSPSGYEVCHNDSSVDRVLYLPIDTPRNAVQFLSAFDLKIACFIKYEFWLNYLVELRRKEVPIILISSIFRQDQVFFRPWGGFYRKVPSVLRPHSGSGRRIEIFAKRYRGASNTGDWRHSF